MSKLLPISSFAAGFKPCAIIMFNVWSNSGSGVYLKNSLINGGSPLS
jgi:hypothetical protein